MIPKITEELLCPAYINICFIVFSMVLIPVLLKKERKRKKEKLERLGSPTLYPKKIQVWLPGNKNNFVQ